MSARMSSAITLDREGAWRCDGVPITHPRVTALFDRSIERRPEGGYLLHIGEERCPIAVEDAPVQVRSLKLEGERLMLALSSGEEPLSLATLRLRGDTLYCTTARGLTARFSRQAQGALAPLLEEPTPGHFALGVGGTLFPISSTPNDEQ